MVQRYSLIIEGDDRRIRIKFNANGKMSYKATLEQIDYVTSQYKDVESFLTSLKKSSVFDFNPKGIYIAYMYNHEEKRMPLVFDSSLIRYASMSILRQKQKKVSNPKIEKNEEILNYIKKIKGYAITENSYKSMRKKSFPFFIRKKLEEYLKINSTNFLTPNMQVELKDINNEIEYNMLDYRNFRDVIMWEKKYLESLEKKKINPTPDYIQYQLVDYFEQPNKKHEEIQEEQIFDINESLSSSVDEGVTTADEISNPRVREAYEKYDGDIEILIEIFGQDYLDTLSDEDQYLIGYTDYQTRQR